jgi:hypothetical protein
VYTKIEAARVKNAVINLAARARYLQARAT